MSWLGGARKALVAGLTLCALCLGLGLAAITASAGASDNPPAPDLDHFVPASDQIVSTLKVHLTHNGPAQEVVDYESAQPNAQGKTPRDLIILSWDHFAKRWVTVWDGAKTQAPDSGPSTGGLASNAVFPSAAYVTNLEYRPIISSKERTDLEFSNDLSAGANGSIEVGIVHYDGQVASVAYYDLAPAGPAQPKVIGKAPHQEVSVPISWLTDSDAQCCPVRNYTNTVGLRTQSYRGYRSTSTSYVITESTQSWLGVYAVLGEQTNGTWPNPVVLSVVPSSPAAGLLDVGDQIVSVSGVNPPATTGNGPAVLDEIAKEAPGAKIALNIIRNGTPRVVNITLGSTAEAAYTGASAPSPGYLGVDITSMTAALRSEYNFAPSSGAIVLSVVADSPASNAGLVQGDVITSFGSTPITSSDTLQSAIQLTPSGTTVEVGYTDTSGNPQSASMVLAPPAPGTPGTQVTPI